MDRAAVRGDRVALGIFGGDGHGERLASGDAGGRRDLEVVDRRGRWWWQEGVQDVGGRLLDPRVCLGAGSVVIQCPAPGHGPGGKDPGPAGSLVDR